MSTSTSTLDSLVADFERHLGSIEKSSLQQWQFAYKRVIFAMGLKILEKFPRNALGPEPMAAGRDSGGEHPGDGENEDGGKNQDGTGRGRGPIFHPATGPWGPIIHVASAVFELAPPPPP
jgi:hypothetical protein